MHYYIFFYCLPRDITLIYKLSRDGLDGGELFGKDSLKIGELAKLAGVTNRTVDYYTNLGLLEFNRSESNYRYYSRAMVDRIKEIEQLKQEGMHLNEIKNKFTSHEVIDIQDLRLKINQLEHDIKHIAQSEDITEARSLAKKDLALIKALLLFIQN
ncbi:MAG: MerR family transcriptional regulator [Macrococcus canis]|uniref:MerR family transcriptional regulator n=1 Tax=Macrococcoides canis TaxID=1855823 RepID=UPI002E7A3404|nr:MerR family transcriptional regulator [Macrococcus canis]MEE1106991.1 MerR family transcriptional regulator [Macrococcus canis]